MKSALRPLSYTVIAALGLGACNLKDAANVLNNDRLVEISGTAAKGLVVGGRITAYPIINGAIDKSNPLGNQETDENGQYAITIRNYSGPVALILTPSGKSSKTKCDVPTGCVQSTQSYVFGQFMPLNFAMEAVIPNLSGDTVSASVTPLTHMAADFAKTRGYTSEAIALANKKAAKMLGIADILTTKPVDITDSTALGSAATTLDSLKYGYLAAAVAKMAQHDYAGDISAALRSLALSYTFNGGELKNNEVLNAVDVVTLAELTAAAQAIIAAETGVSGGIFSLAKRDIETLRRIADASTAGSTTTTNPAVPVGSSDVVAAKSVVTELRTWAQTLNKEFEDQLNPDYVPNPGTSNTLTVSFAKKVQTSIDHGQADFSNLVSGLSIAVEAASEIYYRIKIGTLTDGTHSMTTTGYNVSGDVIVNGTSISVANAIIGGTTVSFSATAPAETGDVFSIEIKSGSANNQGFDLLVAPGSHATLTLDKTLTNVYSGYNAIGNTINPKRLDFSLEATLQQKATTLVTDPVAFTGKSSYIVHFKNVADLFGIGNTTTIPFPTPETITSSGTFSTQSGDKITADSIIHVTNAATFIPFEQSTAPAVGSIWTDAGNYAFSTDGNTLTVDFADGGARIYNLNNTTRRVTLRTRFRDGYEYSRDFVGYPQYTSLANFLETDYYPEKSRVWVDHRGSYAVNLPNTWNTSGGKISGELVQQDISYETPANWADVDSSLSYSVKFAGLPEAKITLTADRTGWRAAQGRATVSYRNVTMILNADYEKAEAASSSIFNSALVVDVAGTGLIEIYPDFQNDTLTGSVRVNGNVVGTLEGNLKNNNGMWFIKYSNGDFESLAF